MHEPWVNPIFHERVKFLVESESWDAQHIAAYQLDGLKKIMKHAFDHVPYYRRTWSAAGLSPDDLQTLEDLRKYPTVSKSDAQTHGEEFIPRTADRASLMHRSTGGSTGSPLTVYMDLDHVSRDKATTEYYMKVAGLNIFEHRSIRLYGDKIPDEALRAGRYGHVVDDRKLVMSCYHISKETLSSYLRQMEDFQPIYIHTRPSALYPLARAMKDTGMRLAVGLKAIFMDGEICPDVQLALIEEVFGCRCYLVYGHTEGCVAGISCDRSRYLHFLPQVGVLELLMPDGSWASTEGDRGEMVTTGFNNLMFPLIRYRTSDIGVQTNRICDCGRSYPLLLRVEGRVQDYAVARDGTEVPVAPAIFNYNDMDWKGISQFYVEQSEPGKLVFHIQRELSVAENPELMQRRLTSAFNAILGDGFRTEINYVDVIPRTRIGKFRYLKQNLKLSQDFSSETDRRSA
jgi:phenylacetate-CoA ligase